MTAPEVTREQTRAFVENHIGRELSDEELDRAYRYAVVSAFTLTPDEVREARAFGILG